MDTPGYTQLHDYVLAALARDLGVAADFGGTVDISPDQLRRAAHHATVGTLEWIQAAAADGRLGAVHVCQGLCEHDHHG